jgi:predicted glycogen debranching enzyme
MSFNFTDWLLQQAGETNKNAISPVNNLDRDVRFDNREFLITNGLGSYASASISGANTRRYHALLCASEIPPTSRRVHLSRVDETLRFEGGRAYNLDTNFWSSGHVSQGYRFLHGFTTDPTPSWHYEFPEGSLIKQVVMLPGKQQVIVGYSWIARDASNEFTQHPEIDVKIIVNNRDFHSETKGWNDWRFEQDVQKKFARIKAYDEARELTISWDGGKYRREDEWYWGYHWPRERDRGLSDTEDAYLAGTVTSFVPNGKTFSIMVSLADSGERQKAHEKALPIEEAVLVIWNHRKQLLSQVSNSNDPVVRSLALSADNFVVHRQSTNGKSIIAGYHWFGDWGRDTMISLPGLTLATKRFDDARSILTTFGKYLSEGMLPNNFPDTGEQPAYNTSDATFWWAWALYKFYQATGDLAFIAAQIPLLEQVVEWHVTGTRYDLHVDQSDGLITGGDTNIQLTWMDAKCGDFVVTPRTGKCVEINALWFNFVATLDYFIAEYNASPAGQAKPMEPQTNYRRLAQTILRGFTQFWNSERNCLYDVITTNGGVDDSIRCNQIFAASLPFHPLSDEQCAQVIECVEEQLLTPMGLRTLSPQDKKYQGRYGQGLSRANQYDRDITYHQGTVWPWPMGAYIDAVISAEGESAETLAKINDCLFNIRKHVLSDAGLGTISEIFDGDAPYVPQGCIAQAWSVAELLRIYDEYPQLIAANQPKLHAVKT